MGHVRVADDPRSGACLPDVRARARVATRWPGAGAFGGERRGKLEFRRAAETLARRARLHFTPSGPLAQLGERRVRNAEVRSSILLRSTSLRALAARYG